MKGSHMNLIKLLLEFNKISRELSNIKDNENLGKFLYEKLIKLVKFDAFGLGKIDGDYIKYNFIIENGVLDKNIQHIVNKEKSIIYHSVISNEIIILNDAEKEYPKYIKGRTYIGNTSLIYHSILVYPINVDGKVIGFFSIQDTQPNFFTAEKIVLFKEVGEYLSILYNNLENNHQNNNSENSTLTIESNNTNPVKEFTNELIKTINSIESLAEFFLKKIKKLYNLKELNIYIYKNWENTILAYSLHEDNFIATTIAASDIIINKKTINLDFNNSHLGTLHLDSEELDENFEILLELFILSLGNFLEKEELEFENHEKNQIMSALENSYTNLNIINELVKSITSTMDIKELGRIVYKGLKDIFKSDCVVALAYYNEELNVLDYDIFIDYGKEYLIPPVNVGDNESFATWVTRNKKTVVINDFYKEAPAYLGEISPGDSLQVGHSDTQSLFFIPLYKNDKIIGVFSIQKIELNFFNNYHIELVKNITSFVNIALINLIEARQLSKEIDEKIRYEKKLVKINNQLEKISALDGLTNLYNRRYFEKMLKEFWGKAKKENKNLGFIIFDLDYFKLINDNLGHLEGDKALVQMAGIIKKYVKRNIKFGRFGGDEFVGVVYNPDKEDLLTMGQDIRLALKSKKIQSPKAKDGILSLTMGITIITPSEKNNVNDLFIKADEALYKGKEKGRDQIVFL